MKKQDIFLPYNLVPAYNCNSPLYRYWSDMYDDGVFHMVSPKIERPILTDHIQSDQSRVRNPHWEKI